MKKNNILIVDDEPDFVEALRRTLEAKSFQVVTASSVRQAKEAMSVEPDLVVLGTLTPAGQTFSMYEWLVQHPKHKDLPLLVIDARYEERSTRGLRRFEGLQMNPDEYVSKPIEPALLVLQIQHLLDVATRTIKVLVVDDHTMVRAGICAVLTLQKDMEVVGEACDGQDAIDKVGRLMPDVTLMDIVMPNLSGIEATKVICRQYPQAKILILTQYDEEENMIVAKQSGAFGFIPKKAASSELVTGVRNVSQGKYFPPAFAEIVVP